MKAYLKSIKYSQNLLLVLSIITMMVLPLAIAFTPQIISDTFSQNLYTFSHIFLFFVMMIRPLADIFTKTKWIRPMVILRKGAGVASASIVVSFILAKLIIDPVGYFTSVASLSYWSMENFSFLAHIADFSAIILLITSNNLSKKLLGSAWKKVQKLSYAYFYGSASYVFLTYGNVDLLVAMILVMIVTIIAFVKNQRRRQLIQKQV